MGLFDSNEENVRKLLEKAGLDGLNNLPENKKKTIEKILGLTEFGKSQSHAMGEKSKLSAQISFLEAMTYSNLLMAQQLNQLNKNIEKLLNK